MCILLTFQNQNRFKQTLLNLCGHSTTPAGRANHLDRQEHTRCRCEMFTVLQYKQDFTISRFTTSRFQYIPLLLHSCCFMWDGIQTFFRCFVSWRKTRDLYSDLELTFGKQQLQVGTQTPDMVAVLWRNYISIASSVYDAECYHWSFLRILKNSWALPENRLAKAQRAPVNYTAQRYKVHPFSTVF